MRRPAQMNPKGRIAWVEMRPGAGPMAASQFDPDQVRQISSLSSSPIRRAAEIESHSA
jgi:hypothetical protein